MANLFGKRWTRKQLLERVGDPAQIATVRPHEFTDGKAKGVSAIEFSTGSGFRFTVLPDRGLDIGPAEHAGRSLCWQSCNGVVSPNFYHPAGLEWLYGFGGGLMCTCGLTYHGAPCEDEGVPLGLHGRISNTPAQEVSVETGWEGDEYIIGVRGKVVESSVFGPNLSLVRSIFTFLGQNRLYIHDEVTNEGHKSTPHMMLYHINMGFPVVDAGSRLIAPSLTVTPSTEDAENGKEEYALFTAPRAGYKEKVYNHELAADSKGLTMAGIVNPKLGFGAYVQARKEQLPKLIEWKMMGKGTYVVGVEPATNITEGRATERAAGRLRILKPGEIATYDLEIGVLTGKAECAEFEKAVGKLRGKKRTVIKSWSGA